jgi:hypothetical protein
LLFETQGSDGQWDLEQVREITRRGSMKIVRHGFVTLALVLVVPCLAVAATAESTVTCNDGTTASAGRGACHGHGGVNKAASAGAQTSKSTASAPTTATTVTCKDGTTGPGGRGACRGHGGIDKAAASGAAASKSTAEPAAATTAPARQAAPREPSAATAPAMKVAAGGKSASSDPSGAIARCKDGMYWHGAHHSGSCSHHGGVDEWLDGSKKN